MNDVIDLIPRSLFYIIPFQVTLQNLVSLFWGIYKYYISIYSIVRYFEIAMARKLSLSFQMSLSVIILSKTSVYIVSQYHDISIIVVV